MGMGEERRRERRGESVRERGKSKRKIFRGGAHGTHGIHGKGPEWGPENDAQGGRSGGRGDGGERRKIKRKIFREGRLGRKKARAFWARAGRQEASPMGTSSSTLADHL
jgi:hypothetical protein